MAPSERRTPISRAHDNHCGADLNRVLQPHTVDTTGDEPQTAASIRAARATVADGSSLPLMAAPQERLVAAVSLVLYVAAVARHSVPRGFRRAETGYFSHPARPPNGRA